VDGCVIVTVVAPVVVAAHENVAANVVMVVVGSP